MRGTPKGSIIFCKTAFLASSGRFLLRLWCAGVITVSYTAALRGVIWGGIWYGEDVCSRLKIRSALCSSSGRSI